MHFLITGGAGFIGSHLTEELLDQSYQVTVVDNLVTGKLTNLPQHPNLTFINKNILNCQQSDFTKPIDGIAHLAATPSVTESWLSPLDVHNNNLSATVAVIELVKKLQIPRLVFTSSAAVYGNPVNLPITENHPTQPISPYGLQKLVSEQYVNLFSPEYQFSAVNLRLFNVFGPRQLPDSAYSGVISIFLKLMQENKSITIYGDGSQTRDFVYVKDVARAFALALTTPLSQGQAVTCNIGTGEKISLLQLVDGLKNSFPAWAGEILFAEERLGDIKDSQANISQAQTLLSFQPQHSFTSAIQVFVQHLP
ncbi:MAG: NAD-dependent epimerase/dehydratase family protein [Microcoleaceae cyanobacterium]